MWEKIAIELGIALILELAKRREVGETTKKIITRAQSLEDPKEMLAVIAESPGAKRTIVTVMADLIEKLVGGVRK